MGINKVAQKSFRYKILWYSIKLCHEIYYQGKIEITNLERVPKKGAIVFTPNHQNALMDALVLLFSVNRTIVFLARADIFKKKFFAEILYFFRILPVFRPRDGKGEVKKNLETFSKTSEVLQKNLGLVIFPEGTHTDKQSLLPLKKGFAKIAMQTEEANDFNLGIQLVPVGISYTNYSQCNSTLSINFGHPIDLSPHYDEYKEFPAKALNKIRDKMSDALHENMIHIEMDEDYETNELLMTVFAKNKSESGIKSRILAGQEFLAKLSSWKENNKESFLKLNENVKSFISKTSNFNRRQKVLWTKYSLGNFLLNTIIFLICSPILLVSGFIHYPSYIISHIPSYFIKDKQFHSTFNFLLGIIFIPITFLIEALLLSLLCTEFSLLYFSIVYLISFFVFISSLNWLRNYFGYLKIIIFKLSKNKKASDIASLVAQIKDSIHTI